MKKVRLFAVAAAMGMFASTVAAAEPVVSTGYTTTWEGVEEIIKVDVGNKVVAPVTTIKVVKETRTTDSEYDVTSDSLGFDTEANCWTGLTVSDDENGDNYSDAQVYFNKVDGEYENGYFYASRTEALEDYLVRTGAVLAPNAEEQEDVYYSPVLGQFFADLEAVYDFLEEKGLVESVYDEDGDLEAVYINAKTITDKKGNELAKTRWEVTALTGRKSELRTKEAVAAKLIKATHNENVIFNEKVLANYVEEKSNPLPFEVTWTPEGATTTTTTPLPLGSIIIVEEHKGEYNVVDVIDTVDATTGVATAANYTYAGWSQTLQGGNVAVKGTKEKITVLELVDDGEVSKLATVSQTKVGKYTPKAKMVWDVEVGSFVKETLPYGNDFSIFAEEEYKGYWDTYAYEIDEEDNEKDPASFTVDHMRFANRVFDILPGTVSTLENPTDKWLLVSGAGVSGVNVKDGKITLENTAGKDITVNAVEIEDLAGDDVVYPAFDSFETLVKVAAKLEVYGNIGIKFDDKDTVEGIVNSGAKVEHQDYIDWYNETEKLANDPWSGFEDVATPKSELRGAGSEACSYVVSVESETVDATVEASEVDTTEAGVKTMTLSAKVDGEVVATKDVKVVVAPRYERQYVNGKVAVLKAYYAKAEKVLYSEYHYDWANGTYTATFYANDGVTVASTASGSLN